MRTSEFEGAMEELGFTIEIDSYDEMHVNNSCGTVASVPKNKIYIIDTDWDDFEKLEENKQSELFFILTDYASTPIAEREEEKRYLLKLIAPSLTETSNIFLNKVINKTEYFLDDEEESPYCKVAFTESELKNIDETGFDRIEVEQ